MHDRNDSKSEHTNALNIVFKVQPTSFIASTRSLSSVSYPECFIIVRIVSARTYATAGSILSELSRNKVLSVSFSKCLVY